jgi:hypothetical protein
LSRTRARDWHNLGRARAVPARAQKGAPRTTHNLVGKQLGLTVRSEPEYFHACGDAPPSCAQGGAMSPGCAVGVYRLSRADLAHSHARFHQRARAAVRSAPRLSASRCPTPRLPCSLSGRHDPSVTRSGARAAPLRAEPRSRSFRFGNTHCQLRPGAKRLPWQIDDVVGIQDARPSDWCRRSITLRGHCKQTTVAVSSRGRSATSRIDLVARIWRSSARTAAFAKIASASMRALLSEDDVRR